MAIIKVAQGQIDPLVLRAAVLQQKAADSGREQKNENQFKHGLYGSHSEGLAWILRPVSAAQTNDFILGEIKKAQAIDLSKATPEQKRKAGVHLGNAMHAAQDLTSPSHAPFQRWDNDGSKADQMKHASGEMNYPAAGTKSRQELEGATKWVMDMYLKKAPMPKSVIGKDLQLALPNEYRASNPVTTNTDANNQAKEYALP